MAEYDYDEGGFMALYFLLTFLIIVLFILTPSLIPSWRAYIIRITHSIIRPKTKLNRLRETGVEELSMRTMS